MIIIFTIVFFIFLLFGLWFFLRLDRRPRFTDSVNLYFGSPGCGKTTFLVSDSFKYKKMGYDVYTNIFLNHTKYFDKSYLGKYEFPPKSILLFDEGSLNGFDNRDFKANFKDSNVLVYLKMIRHYKNKIVFYNQGYDELDKKIRTLCLRNWYVKKIGPFSMATKIDKKVEIDKETHDIKDGYYKPSIFSIIFNRSCVRIIFRPWYYKYFDSYNKLDLGLIPYPDPDEQ